MVTLVFIRFPQKDAGVKCVIEKGEIDEDLHELQELTSQGWSWACSCSYAAPLLTWLLPEGNYSVVFGNGGA